MGIVIYLFLCAVVAVAASRRERDGVRWFFIALLVSPLISAILLLVLPDKQTTLQRDLEEMEAWGADQDADEIARLRRRVSRLESAENALPDHAHHEGANATGGPDERDKLE